MSTRGGAGAPPFRLFWGTDPADAAHVVSRLSPAERERYDGLIAARARTFVRGRAVLFDALDALEPRNPLDPLDPQAPSRRGVTLTLEARCTHCGGAHGAPVIAGAPLVASISHGRDVSVAVLAESAAVAAIGVDTEHERASAERLGAIVSLTGAAPDRALRHWTHVEAVLKADGRGLRVDPSAVWMSGPRHPHAAASATINGGARVYDVYDVTGPEDHLTTVALRSRF